ncbi:hypothetical protein QFC19_000410 [Naganishia cerealis]|uniref:Uncharacterized protein n=1 Tax=Naganishia cerealis TaxID=610337 RepID=A0ACC2WM79_9TREE|nr:hypothetical protein QFC19_000410 [Naganishia cerealis]
MSVRERLEEALTSTIGHGLPPTTTTGEGHWADRTPSVGDLPMTAQDGGMRSGEGSSVFVQSETDTTPRQPVSATTTHSRSGSAWTGFGLWSYATGGAKAGRRGEELVSAVRENDTPTTRTTRTTLPPQTPVPSTSTPAPPSSFSTPAKQHRRSRAGSIFSLRQQPSASSSSPSGKGTPRTIAFEPAASAAVAAPDRRNVNASHAAGSEVSLDELREMPVVGDGEDWHEDTHGDDDEWDDRAQEREEGVGVVAARVTDNRATTRNAYPAGEGNNGTADHRHHHYHQHHYHLRQPRRSRQRGARGGSGTTTITPPPTMIPTPSNDPHALPLPQKQHQPLPLTTPRARRAEEVTGGAARQSLLRTLSNLPLPPSHSNTPVAGASISTNRDASAGTVGSTVSELLTRGNRSGSVASGMSFIDPFTSSGGDGGTSTQQRRRSRASTLLPGGGGGGARGLHTPGTEGEGEGLVRAVEMEALIKPRDRPPAMLLRRATTNMASGDDINRTSSPSAPNGRTTPTPTTAAVTTDPANVAKVPSRFGGADVRSLEPYIDRYGFVYHLKYVQMLLDLQQGIGDMDGSEEEEEEKEEKEEEGQVQKQAGDHVVPPHMIEVESGGKPTVGRSRSRTIATFNPSPSRPTISSSNDHVVTVPPPAAATPPPPTGSISLRARKAKLDQLAAKYRRPLVSLLGQLSEMHDKQEQERMKRWQQFLRYRSQRLPAALARGGGTEEGGQEDVIGVAHMGDGKIGRDVMKRFTSLVHRTGIPMALRASVWAECSGAKEAFTPGEYQEILAVHHGDQHPTLVEIEKDVRRTFPTNVFFGGDGVGCEKLRRCLSAYAWRDPQIGYCQGMNLIAATLLLTYDDEEQAYWTFVSIIKNMLPDDWFTSSLQGSMIEQAVIGDLVATLLPDVEVHLLSLGVDLSAITFGWILSLFANCLPFETLLRIWDCFMVEGRDVIPCTVIAILRLGEEGILASENVEELFEYLNTITERLWTADRLVSEQFKNSITSTELDRRRKDHLKLITSTPEVKH